jgi:hypothetical protein
LPARTSVIGKVYGELGLLLIHYYTKYTLKKNSLIETPFFSWQFHGTTDSSLSTGATGTGVTIAVVGADGLNEAGLVAVGECP